MPVSLDAVVTSVATRLMSATADDATPVSQRVLENLNAYFDVDVSFLRHNDHGIRASRLIAEWPPRPEVPDPDPLALVYFEDADPVFAASEHGKTPAVFRPEPDTDDYQRRIEAGRQVPTTSMAAAPLISGELTTGVLGFVKYGDRNWTADELNALEAIASLFAQLQARINAETQLRFLAHHDDLTGMHNRRSLMAHLDERLGSGQSGTVALLFFDLDRLKAINDFLGHDAGDHFIKAAAKRLGDKVGSSSLIARLGGDEFVVVPADRMGTVEAEALARDLHVTLCERIDIDGKLLTRTVSIGVAAGVPGFDSASDLLRRADHAVLSAKMAGGNQVSVFTHGMSKQIEFRNDIELHLQGVIESEALTLHYLPEVDMRTGEILAIEALVRWQHPVWGLLSPDAFIGVAESINLAAELGRWVISAACSQLASWRYHGVRVARLRMNISPVQLVTDGFVTFVAEVINDCRLDGSSLCLEITENVVVQDIGTTRATLLGLKELGVQVAIDDFGTGYSVLSYLKDLPVDTLKIDRSFIRELGVNPGDLAIVRAIIALADAFGLELVAEGVETELAARTLLDHGCYRAQGFLLSRPLDREAMEALLVAGRVPVAFPAAVATGHVAPGHRSTESTHASGQVT